MSSIESSIAAVLAERARQQSNAPAYTFIDYEVDPAGYSQSLTWSQAHRRAQMVAGELGSCGSPGDRVAICAPQGFEYIAGFHGVLGRLRRGHVQMTSLGGTRHLAEDELLQQLSERWG
jgi:long-chain fatty acid adenylase/transferase FadD26